MAQLNKVHSLDYAASGNQKVCSTNSSSGGTRNAQLMHSVSIVVELAKEQQQQQPCALPVAQHPPPLPSPSPQQNQSTTTLMEAEEEEDDDNLPQEDLSQSIDMLTDTDEQAKQHNPLPVGPSAANCPTDVAAASKSMSLDLEEDDEDEDDDDDDGGCLSSDLARKVVIVDEADKILRTRAQSAEPRLSLFASSASISPTLLEDNTSCISETITDAATCSLNPRPQSALLAENITNNSPTTRHAKFWTSSGGSSELAEHGELSKLGMRRNTHHYVAANQQQQPKPPLVGGSMRPSIEQKQQQHVRSGSAQLERPPPYELPLGGGNGQFATKSPSRSHGLRAVSPSPIGSHCAAAQVAGQRNWPSTPPQRRQSLQINLLTGVSSKLLTEEELRGEREFNKQVRSCSKSPDIFPIANTATTTTTTATTTNSSLNGSGSNLSGYVQAVNVSSGSSRRCQSVSSPRGAFDVSCLSSAAVSPTEVASGGKLATNSSSRHQHQQIPHSIVKNHLQQQASSHQKQQQQQKQKQRHSQRRVSFSSIDPILVRASHEHRAPPSRASFAFQAPNYYPSPSTNPNLDNSSSQLPINSLNSQPICSSNSNPNNNNNNNNNNLTRKSFGGKAADLWQQQQIGSEAANDASSSVSGSHFNNNNNNNNHHQLANERHKRHSIATYNTSNYSNSCGGIQNNSKLNSNQHQQSKGESMDHSNIQSNDNKGNSKLANVTTTIEDQDCELRNNRAPGSDSLNLIMSPQETTTTVRNEAMNDNAPQQDPSTSVEERQTDLVRSPPEVERDDETENNGNNWTITSSTNTNTTTPTNAAATKQPTNKPLKDGSRVQSIMANAKLRQEEFARLLEEHEQIVNEINRVETKMSNSSCSRISTQQQPTTAQQEKE